MKGQQESLTTIVVKSGLADQGNRNSVGSHQESSPAQAQSWATPTARDNKSGRGNANREYSELTPQVERQQSGKLNPRWVETLMGLPVGWVMPSCQFPVTIEPTNSDSLETELFQQPPMSHGSLF